MKGNVSSFVKSFLLSVFFIQVHGKLCPSIDVREAQESDLESIIELDRRVSFQFFQPMYTAVYAQYDFGKNAHETLEQEINKKDAQEFAECVKNQEDKRLYIACDDDTHKPVGLIYFHRQEDRQSIEIDLLLVDQSHRGKGIGKQLVRAACKAFEGIKICDVYSFKRENSTTLTFYEKIGFINMGDGPVDRINSYGISFAELYFHYRLDVSKITLNPDLEIATPAKNH